MIIIDKGNMAFEVDRECTESYYKNKQALSGLEMENFRMHAKMAAPLLTEYLEEFGVDITKPDEFCYCWKDDQGMLHYNVAYTITGKIVKAIQYETVLQDKSSLHLVLETEYVPNQQTDAYFAFTVYNIEMPWSLDAPYPEVEKAQKRTKEGMLTKLLKKLKKY